MWRYREAIPVSEDKSIVTFDEGFTPLIPLDFGTRTVWIKQDHLFPTGSYKDRGASVLVSKIKELGVPRVVEDSSGNAGCAIAAYCAKAKVRCRIFVPQDTSPGKLAQIQSYGAELNKIPGSREDTARAAFRAAEKDYYASHSWNPFFFQGTKLLLLKYANSWAGKDPMRSSYPSATGLFSWGPSSASASWWRPG